jgi:hypothetical protein
VVGGKVAAAKSFAIEVEWIEYQLWIVPREDSRLFWDFSRRAEHGGRKHRSPTSNSWPSGRSSNVCGDLALT